MSLFSVIFGKALNQNPMSSIVYEANKLESFKRDFEKDIKNFEQQFEGNVTKTKLQNADLLLRKANINALRVGTCVKHIKKHKIKDDITCKFLDGANKSNQDTKFMYKEASRKFKNSVKNFERIPPNSE